MLFLSHRAQLIEGLRYRLDVFGKIYHEAGLERRLGIEQQT